MPALQLDDIALNVKAQSTEGIIHFYPVSTGRSLKKIIRILDSLQLTDLEGVATPADWEPGEEVIILPSNTNAEATQRFPKGFWEVNSYIGYTTISMD